MSLGLGCRIPVVVCWLENLLLHLRYVSVDILSYGNFNLISLTYFIDLLVLSKVKFDEPGSHAESCMTCWFAKYRHIRKTFCYMLFYIYIYIYHAASIYR